MTEMNDEGLTVLPATEGEIELRDAQEEASLARDLQTTANGAGEVSTVDESGSEKSRKFFVPSHGKGLLQIRDSFPPDMVRTGRPPSPTARLRDRMREGLDNLLPALYDDVRDGKINRLQFADFLAKYSIGTTGTVTHVAPEVIHRLERQAMLIASRPTWESRELLACMRDIWA